MAPKTPFVKFNNGLEFPAFGLGAWRARPGEVCQAVKDAIDAGYRHIDCAHCYQFEKEVGEAVAAKIKEGVVKREDLYFTSKVWNAFHKAELVLPALKTTLSDLGIDCVDLYLVHWPTGFLEGSPLFPRDAEGKTLYSDDCYTAIWKEMEKCVKDGLIKSIGVSNFNSNQIEKIWKIAEIKPVTNQVECHPYLGRLKLQEFCRSKGIILSAFSPFATRACPYTKPGTPWILEDPKIVAIAQKYSKPTSQVLINYQIQRGNIVVPKANRKSEIENNIGALDFKISKEDVEAINTFDTDGKIKHLEEIFGQKDPFAVDKTFFDEGYNHD